MVTVNFDDWYLIINNGNDIDKQYKCKNFVANLHFRTGNIWNKSFASGNNIKSPEVAENVT